MIQPFSAFGLVLFGSIFGFIVGIVVGIVVAAAQPLCLQEWENYRKAKESRRRLTQALDSISELIAKKKAG